MAYNGYENLDMVAVTVIDDDVAGVTYTEDSLATVLNNYGDAQSTDSYSVYLESEPTANVTISTSGLGSWSSASPSSLTFTSSNWGRAHDPDERRAG